MITIIFTTKESGPPKALTNPSAQKEFPLIQKDQISHDTYLFKFGLPTPESVLGIKVGEHILIQYLNHLTSAKLSKKMERLKRFLENTLQPQLLIKKDLLTF